MTGTLHEDVFVFMAILGQILFRMRNGLDKRYRENRNTYFIFNNFFSENRVVREIMSKNMVKSEGPQMTSQHGAYALHAGKARLHARTRMHTPMRPGTRTHAHKDQ
jgi:hypothetical protein